MSTPLPSRYRLVEIYRERAPSRTRGLVGPTTRYKWAAKHPLDNRDPWWIGAVGWLTDLTGKIPWDTIGQIAIPQILPDTALSITGTVISGDGLHAGIYFSGGTPGASPIIRFVLTGADTGAQKGIDIILPIENVAVVQVNPPGITTLNGSVVTIGARRFPFSAQGT